MNSERIIISKNIVVYRDKREESIFNKIEEEVLKKVDEIETGKGIIERYIQTSETNGDKIQPMHSAELKILIRTTKEFKNKIENSLLDLEEEINKELSKKADI